MSYRQTILPDAQREYDDAIEWYAKQQKGLGKRFTAAVKQVLRRLRAMPNIHAIAAKDIRRALVKDFPYVVLYRVIGDDVIVVSIFHTSRNPADWQSRV
jgi:plasmid stabilization system protein ParE